MRKKCEPEKSKQKTGAGLRARLLKGIGAQSFSQAVQIFIRLAEVPLLLSYWGTQLYGEWLMLSAIPVYLSISDGGFSGAACRDMTIRSGEKDRSQILAVFQSVLVLLVVASTFTFILVFVFLQFFSVEDWLGFSILSGDETEMVFLLLVVHVLVSFQGGLLRGGFWIAGCYSNSMYSMALTQLMEFAGLAIMVVLGRGPVQAAVGYLIGRMLGTGLMWMGQRKVSPWLKHGFMNASWTEIKRLAAPALSSLAFPLGHSLNIQGMRLVVGILLGPPAVALFVPLRTLSRVVMQPANIISRLIEPELALAYGSKDSSLFHLLFTKSCQVALWGCLAACTIIGPFSVWFFPAWTDGRLSIHWPAYLLLLLGVLINSLWNTAMMMPYAINRHMPITAYYILVYGIATVVMGFLGAACIGLSGTALALVVGEIAMAVIVIRITLQMDRISMVEWVKIVFKPLSNLLEKIGESIWKKDAVSPE
jgi:O-antigen/teichoic acid export membrane protein